MLATLNVGIKDKRCGETLLVRQILPGSFAVEVAVTADEYEYSSSLLRFILPPR